MDAGGSSGMVLGLCAGLAGHYDDYATVLAGPPVPLGSGRRLALCPGARHPWELRRFMSARNAEIAEAFNRLAELLEIEGANPFRIRAYRNAARTVAELPTWPARTQLRKRSSRPSRNRATPSCRSLVELSSLPGTPKRISRSRPAEGLKPDPAAQGGRTSWRACRASGLS